jgi:hypothetical protein
MGVVFCTDLDCNNLKNFVRKFFILIFNTCKVLKVYFKVKLLRALEN